jgi:hypothetical protein
MPALDIVDRLKLLSRGDNLDLADIVCGDAIAEIELFRARIAEQAREIARLEESIAMWRKHSYEVGMVVAGQ